MFYGDMKVTIYCRMCFENECVYFFAFIIGNEWAALSILNFDDHMSQHSPYTAVDIFIWQLGTESLFMLVAFRIFLWSK